MAHPLESAYDWRPPVAVSGIGVLLCIAVLAASQTIGWLSASVVVALCWAVYLVVVWVRTQAYLMVDGDTLTVRTFRVPHRITGSELVRVSQVLTSRGPSYRLRVRAVDGTLHRYGAQTALLRRGHATLFRWILTWAPQAELDKASRRTLHTLRERGAVPYPDDEPDRISPPPPTQLDNPHDEPVR